MQTTIEDLIKYVPMVRCKALTPLIIEAQVLEHKYKFNREQLIAYMDNKYMRKGNEKHETYTRNATPHKD